ncbi:MAG: prepilin-type N-terminal cleavage/methylation domain-containing protein [Pseudomonadales bacterium]|nr:prepilin-type N-terminal cleavage/methylation domain-containing protein [Pseudomonadales bacterium]
MQSGFTLLEVMVALAITGFVLGSLFSLVGGSKQLTWRSEDSLLRATELRAVTNFALLQNEFNEVEPILESQNYRIIANQELEDPERKTQPTLHALQAFEVLHEDREDSVIGTRWIQRDLPR